MCDCQARVHPGIACRSKRCNCHPDPKEAKLTVGTEYEDLDPLDQLRRVRQGLHALIWRITPIQMLKPIKAALVRIHSDLSSIEMKLRAKEEKDA